MATTATAHPIDTVANDWIDRLSASSTARMNLRQYGLDAESGKKRPDEREHHRDSALRTQDGRILSLPA